MLIGFWLNWERKLLGLFFWMYFIIKLFCLFYIIIIKWNIDFNVIVISIVVRF